MTWARARVTPFALLVLAGCKGPKLETFNCGGVAGYRCPPASTCGGCSEPDCIAGCYASTRCDPVAPKCPGGYACDTASKYCMPAKVCDTKGDCPTGQSCKKYVTWKGICTPGPCTDEGCE
jgi:hypothetical protein